MNRVSALPMLGSISISQRTESHYDSLSLNVYNTEFPDTITSNVQE